MNPAITAINERYSCRNYTDQMPTEIQFEILAKAGVAAPSSMNLQPWKIIVVENKQLIKELEEEVIGHLKSMEDGTMWQRMEQRGGKPFYNAPSMIVVAIDKKTSYAAELDCGIVSQNISIAATSMGLGNVYCGFSKLAIEGPNGDYFKEKLGFPQGYTFGSSLLIGHVKESKEPHTPDLSKVSYIK